MPWVTVGFKPIPYYSIGWTSTNRARQYVQWRTFPRKGGRGLKGSFDVMCRRGLQTLTLFTTKSVLSTLFTMWLLEPGHLEKDYPITFFWKQKIQVFWKRTNKIQGSTMQPLRTIKPFELAWRLRKKHSNLWMLSVRLQKYLRTLCFQKSCDSVIFREPRFEQSYSKTRQVLLWCEIHCINEITGSGTYSLLFLIWNIKESTTHHQGL